MSLHTAEYLARSAYYDGNHWSLEPPLLPSAPSFFSCALSDTEHTPPLPPDRPIMSDKDDTRDAATLVPETDREPQRNMETKPPVADPVAEELAIPKAAGIPREALQREVKQGDSYFEEAARDFAASLVEMRRTRLGIEQGFRDQEAKQAERHAEATANAQLVASAIRAHGDRLIALERGAEQTTESITALKEELRLARVAADEAVRLARQALELVQTLEERLPKVESCDAPESTSTATEPT
jgi:hypothetical protein